MPLSRIVIAVALSVFTHNASADCFDDAAAFHGVNPWILRAIAVVESEGCRGRPVNRNADGSIDVGCTQTNSVHFPELARYGIQANDLLDPCKSIHVAGWLLRKKINKHGNTWTAVGAYHSETPQYRDKYAAKVRAIVSSWIKTPPQAQ